MSPLMTCGLKEERVVFLKLDIFEKKQARVSSKEKIAKIKDRRPRHLYPSQPERR